MQKKISLFVISIHFILIFMLFFSPAKIKPSAKHIAVRTIQPHPKTRAMTAAAPQKKAASAAAPKSQAPANAAPKKATAKAAAPKTAAVKSKPINQKKPSVVEKGKLQPTKPKPEVWKEIDEALAKIDDKVYSKPQSKLDVPQVKGSSPSKLLFPDFGEIEEEEETLVSFLHMSLNLPEVGEVKIQLTIKKDGSVGRLVVLEAQSQKNKAYLQKNLPLLRFPLIFDKEKTFTLTFCNET